MRQTETHSLCIQSPELDDMEHLLVHEEMMGKDPVCKSSSRANLSCFTETTETTENTENTSRSDEINKEEIYRVYPQEEYIWTATHTDETDSVSIPSVRTSLDDYGATLPDGIPTEIVIVVDDYPKTKSDPMIDLHNKLQIAENLVKVYKERMQSNDHLTDSLHVYLRQAQEYAEDVLADRNELMKVIEEMDDEADEQNLSQHHPLQKSFMAISLFFYMCGGSPLLLMFAVGLYLLSDAINFFVN